jgi:hypothetical protein
MDNGENRVFDVSGPQPTPTSRPIIVGHHPTMNDPMVRRAPAPVTAKRINVKPEEHGEPESHLAKEIPVPPEIQQHIEKARKPLAGMVLPVEGETPATPMTQHAAAVMPPAMPPEPALATAPTPVMAAQSSTSPTTTPTAEIPAPAQPNQEAAALPTAALPTPDLPAAQTATVTSATAAQPVPAASNLAEPELHLQSLPVSHMGGGGGKLGLIFLWVIVVGLLTAAGLYMLIDAGIIGSGVDLPVHILNN